MTGKAKRSLDLSAAGRWRLLGWGLMALSFVSSVGSNYIGGEYPGGWLWICALLFIVGGYCLKRGRRFCAPSADEAMIADSSSPVLYLRSFKADRESARLTGASGHGIVTEEEELAQALNCLGPFIAVGIPGEELPQLGAARMQLTDTTWRDRVTELMTRSSLVVLRAGDSPGFWWELEQTVRLVEPRRVLLLVPFRRRQYEIFRQQAQKKTSLRFPYFRGKKVTDSSIRSVICFDHQWTPRMIPLRGSIFVHFTTRDLSLLRREPGLTRALKRTLPSLLDSSRTIKGLPVIAFVIVYAMAAYFLIQIASQILPGLEIPNWVPRLFIILLVLGLPATLAWRSVSRRRDAHGPKKSSPPI